MEEIKTPKIDSALISSKMMFWPEYSAVGFEFKFSPFGGATIPIPNFHRENSAELSMSLSDLAFQYQHPFGRADAREAFVKYFPEIKYFNDNGIEINIHKNLSLTGGAVPGINTMIDAVVEAGQEIIAYEPIYPFHYSKLLTKPGIDLKILSMKMDKELNNLVIDFEELEKAITEKTRLLILVNPNNPTSRAHKKEEWEKLATIVEKFPNLLVLEDRAYFLYFDDKMGTVPFGSLSKKCFEQSITFYSGGKMFNTTGARIGFCVTSEKTMQLFGKKVFAEVILASAFDQSVVAVDLKCAHEQDFYETTRKDIMARVEFVGKELAKRVPDVKLMKFEGTYFIMLDVENLRGKIEEEYYYALDDPKLRVKELDKAVCRKLYKNSDKIGMMPLSCMYFSEDHPDNIVRVSINRKDDDLKLFLDAMETNFGPKK